MVVYGQNYQITIYVPESVFRDIEQCRGNESRSGFISAILISLDQMNRMQNKYKEISALIPASKPRIKAERM